MRAALLHFSSGEVFKFMEKACSRNGFLILTSNEKSGEITAVRGKQLLGNKTNLDLKVKKVDKLVTKVIIEVVVNGFRKNNIDPVKIEEKIVDTIYKLF